MDTIEFIDKKINWLKIKKPEIWFENSVILSRVVFLVLLIILGFLNADISFISNNPREFLTETFLAAILAAIPTILMAYNRGTKTADIISATLITFSIFFIFNTLMEFSGLNGYLYGYNLDLNNKIQKERIDAIESQWWVWMIVVIISLTMIYLSIITHDFPKRMLWTILLTELAVFSIFNTIPKSIIAYNRGANVVYATFISIIFYIVVYITLQSGGFFTHIYGSINHRIYEIGVSSPEPGDLIKSVEHSNQLNSSTESNENDNPVERHYQGHNKEKNEEQE